MIGSVLKLSTDPKVLGVIAESAINLGKYKVLEPNTAKLLEKEEKKANKLAELDNKALLHDSK
ncbi:hypothetical protein [Rickettsia endosymbiont of Cantharis rufa]|uniref:hypothetical protein n=1 Tax=Rickettsia endosymbiont of Cantharis rufa TaxID=3066248 RepID=UPI0031334133